MEVIALKYVIAFLLGILLNWAWLRSAVTAAFSWVGALVGLIWIVVFCLLLLCELVFWTFDLSGLLSNLNIFLLDLPRSVSLLLTFWSGIGVVLVVAICQENYRS